MVRLKYVLPLLIASLAIYMSDTVSAAPLTLSGFNTGETEAASRIVNVHSWTEQKRRKRKKKPGRTYRDSYKDSRSDRTSRSDRNDNREKEDAEPEFEQKPGIRFGGPPEELTRFHRDGGGWKDFKRRHRHGIKKFGRKKLPNARHEKSAYYYYNYKYGYFSDNCEFVRGPERYCWYDNEGKRECRWKLKWQYSCF